MASMQGNNILGEKKKEAKARSASGITGFDQDGTGLAEGLGSGQEAQDQDQTEWRTACGMWEKRVGEKKSGGLSLPTTVADN